MRPAPCPARPQVLRRDEKPHCGTAEEGVTVRGLFRSRSTMFLVFGALAVIPLAISGFHRQYLDAGLTPAEPGARYWLNLVYAALQLFILESGYNVDDVARPFYWDLELARWLAVLV